MNIVKGLFASVALAASLGAQAQVTGALGGGSGTFLVLSAPATCTLATPCTLTGSVNATIVGGTILNSDQPFADIPAGATASFHVRTRGTFDPAALTRAPVLRSANDVVTPRVGARDLTQSPA